MPASVFYFYLRSIEAVTVRVDLVSIKMESIKWNRQRC